MTLTTGFQKNDPGQSANGWAVHHRFQLSRGVLPGGYFMPSVESKITHAAWFDVDRELQSGFRQAPAPRRDFGTGPDPYLSGGFKIGVFAKTQCYDLLARVLQVIDVVDVVRAVLRADSFSGVEVSDFVGCSAFHGGNLA